MKCFDCGGRNRASGDRCRACRKKVRQMNRQADALGWTVDRAGGGWWVWSARGDVLGMGDRRNQALAQALAGHGA